MHIIRRLFSAMFIIALASSLGCSKAGPKNVQPVLDKISHAPAADLPTLVYGDTKLSAETRLYLLAELSHLRSPSQEQRMKVVATRQSGPFTMIVAQVPWPNGNLPGGYHQPIIITGKAGKEQVVGTVVPFKEILPLMKVWDLQAVTKLSQWYMDQYAQADLSGVQPSTASP